jgi:membrane-associated protease RseP (regulator of RpoE activity)
MGHYLMARRHGVRVTLPYFIPLPTLLGTMGAVIAMQEPSPNRRVQFDIGVAGPLAGLVIAIPVLVVGLVLSPLYTRQEILQIIPEGQGLIQEGNSLLYLGLKFAVFGKVLPTPGGEDILVHAMAWAGWAGLLVTALNLIPVGQLDGGHVLYGLVGERAQVLRWPIIILLLALSFLYQGWLLWAFLIFLLARRSAPVLDEITTLDRPRQWIAVVVLVIFVLIFVPVPLKQVPLP